MKTIVPAHFVPQTTTYTFSLDDPDIENKIATMFAEIEEEGYIDENDRLHDIRD